MPKPMTALDSLALRTARSRIVGRTPEGRLRDALALRRAERTASLKARDHMKFSLLHDADTEYALHKGTTDYCRAMVRAFRRIANDLCAELRQTRDLADLDRPTFSIDALRAAHTTAGNAGIMALVRGDQ